MADCFVGEIRMMGFDFAPRGWAHCDGALLNISQFSMLFALLGNRFGGDGQTTFALPDLRGRVPVHPGDGIPEAARWGYEQVRLVDDQIPAHTHPAYAAIGVADQNSPEGCRPAQGEVPVYGVAAGLTDMGATAEPAGDGWAHDNLQPSLVVNFCIALTGEFPPRE